MDDPRLTALAAIHSACFTGPMRPWSAAEIAGLLQSPGSFLLTRPGAFLIGRSIADEAELLTLATAPHARRQGLARELLREFTITASTHASTAFLEVEAQNLAALALYQGEGWAKAGQRRDYYAPGHHAAILTRSLGQSR